MDFSSQQGAWRETDWRSVDRNSDEVGAEKTSQGPHGISRTDPSKRDK
ncbi:hypothetical protein AGMMS49992_12590 [Clostridia bacterium]|nr:hypothetical protein AGMMS49992_12590 [Clostridia bacterium]